MERCRAGSGTPAAATAASPARPLQLICGCVYSSPRRRVYDGEILVSAKDMVLVSLRFLPHFFPHKFGLKLRRVIRFS